jgi:hypothetical protein
VGDFEKEEEKKKKRTDGIRKGGEGGRAVD